MELAFDKYQGAGNDFVIIDDRKNQFTGDEKLIRHLCDRRFGIGADGLMLLRLREGYDFEMVYHNSDGKPGTMCGNGGRCMVVFANDHGINRSSYRFTAADGPHEATIATNGWVNLKMTDVSGIEETDGDFVLNTGSPHYVKGVPEVMKVDVVCEGRGIRNSREFCDEGINVNFVEANEHYIHVRTYERGVEDETLSCGTGVTASALAFAHNDNGFNHVDVRTIGGNLAVEFTKRLDGGFCNIWLSGPAQKVFSGTIRV